MSQEDVEFVRNLYAMIDRGDAEAWDLLPRDFVIDLSRRLIDPVILRGPDEMRAFYRARRDQAVGLLADLGRPIASPQGAFYAMVDLSDAVRDDTAFAHDLLTTHGVAVAPGSAFGPAGCGSVRIALCVGPEALASGLPMVVEAANSAAQAPSPGRSGR